MFLPMLITAAAAAGPLAAVEQGMMQCISPDAATRTCNSLTRFTPDGDGFTSTAAVLLSSRPPVILTSSTRVVVRDDAVRADAVAAVRTAAEGLRLVVRGEAESVLAGPKGNREVFLCLETPRG